MNIPYDRQTIDSPNPLARYAHRNRIRKSIQLALSRLPEGRVLDYGCGSGVFVAEMLALRPDCAVGYEPFMTERTGSDLPIFSTIDAVEARGPYALVTLFETIEHLSDAETADFLQTCKQVLTRSGQVLISGPIEIGPALIAKELNRSFLRLNLPDYGFMEFARASLVGIPAKRAENIKISHRGFDFRRAVCFFRDAGWHVDTLRYGPLPIGTWYGNSQVYLALRQQHKDAS